MAKLIFKKIKNIILNDVFEFETHNLCDNGQTDAFAMLLDAFRRMYLQSLF